MTWNLSLSTVPPSWNSHSFRLGSACTLQAGVCSLAGSAKVTSHLTSTLPQSHPLHTSGQRTQKLMRLLDCVYCLCIRSMLFSPALILPKRLNTTTTYLPSRSYAYKLRCPPPRLQAFIIAREISAEQLQCARPSVTCRRPACSTNGAIGQDA